MDLRDLLFYVSIAVGFLILNAVSLDAKRWSRGEETRSRRRRVRLTTALLLGNLVLLNVWMYPLYGLRADLTSQKQYSLSGATKQLVGGLSEPLLIRAYISKQAHPYLDRLRSQIADMLKEYAIAGKGRVEAETVDPDNDEEMIQEARDMYGISPQPFFDQGRLESSFRNAFFNILVQYGNQHVVLGYGDIITVEPLSDGGAEVRLRNLEYDLTRAVKKSAYGFQSVDSVLAALERPASLVLYATPDTLPSDGPEVLEAVQRVGNEIAENSNGKLRFETLDPHDPDSGATPETLSQQYNLLPRSVSLFSSETFYFSLVLTVEESAAVVNLSDHSDAGIRSAVEASLKRAAPGFLKVVGLWTPPATPRPNPFGQMQRPYASYEFVTNQLRSDYTVRTADLSTGSAPAEIDALVLIAPQNLGEKELFAIDQFLMRGGSVVVATGHFLMEPDPFNRAPSLKPVEGGAHELLRHYGAAPESLVALDPQNAPFPTYVSRNMGGVRMQFIENIDYPFFVDIRRDGMASGHPITANLDTVTMNWASPIRLDPDKNANRTAVELLRSSEGSWTTAGIERAAGFQRVSGARFSSRSGVDVASAGGGGSGFFCELFQRQAVSFGGG